VYTSNIFAIIGLRSLYFLLANFLGMFRFLSVGLAAVLIFVGAKMLAEDWIKTRFDIGQQQMILISLGVIGVILAVAVVASLLIPVKGAPDVGSAPLEDSRSV